MKCFYLLMILAFAFLSLTFPSCKKEFLSNNSNNSGLELKKDTTNNPTRFYWDKAIISNFKSYILVRSDDTIPNGLNPRNSLSILKIVKEITNQSITSFIDYDLPLKKIQHYKLYIDIGNRFVESPDIVDYPDILIYSEEFNIVRIDADTTWAYLLNTFTGKIVIFDYITFKIIGQSVLNGISINPLLTYNDIGLLSEKEGNSRVLFISGKNYIIKYKLPSLDFITSQSADIDCTSLISNKRGLLFSANHVHSAAFNVRKQSDLSKIYASANNNYIDRRTLLLLDSNTNLVAEISDLQFSSFNVDQITGNISNKEYHSSGDEEVLNQIVISKDRKFFIPDYSGTVYDFSLKTISSYKILNTVDYAISDDNQYVYTLYEDENQITNFIKKFTLQDMQPITEIEIPSVNIMKIKAFDKSLILFGINNETNEFIVSRLTF